MRSGWISTDATRLVDCSRCGAKPAEPCRTPKGRKTNGKVPHMERTRKFVKQEQELGRFRQVYTHGVPPIGLKPRGYRLIHVRNDPKITYVTDRPLQVWTILDYAGFLDNGLIHNKTAFIEDYIHDWDWKDDKFRFYGHSGAPGDLHELVLVYEGNGNV